MSSLSLAEASAIQRLSSTAYPNSLGYRPLHGEPLPPASAKTAEVVKECAALTTGSLKVLCSPKYSFFCRGVKGLCQGHSDYFSLGKGMDVLLILASPIEEPVRIGAGIFGVILGVLSTGGSALWYGLQKTGELAGSARARSNLVREERRAFTRTFVERMKEILQNQELSYPQRKEFKDNPKELIGMAVFAVAFRSRDLNGRQLNTAHGLISDATIEHYPQICKDYFEYVYEMKQALQNFGRSLDNKQAQAWLDNEKAWILLAKAYLDLSEENELKYKPNQVADLTYIVERAELICEMFVEDSYFKEEWDRAMLEV